MSGTITAIGGAMARASAEEEETETLSGIAGGDITATGGGLRPASAAVSRRAQNIRIYGGTVYRKGQRRRESAAALNTKMKRKIVFPISKFQAGLLRLKAVPVARESADSLSGQTTLKLPEEPWRPKHLRCRESAVAQMPSDTISAISGGDVWRNPTVELALAAVLK